METLKILKMANNAQDSLLWPNRHPQFNWKGVKNGPPLCWLFLFVLFNNLEAVLRQLEARSHTTRWNFRTSACFFLYRLNFEIVKFILIILLGAFSLSVADKVSSMENTHFKRFLSFLGNLTDLGFRLKLMLLQRLLSYTENFKHSWITSQIHSHVSLSWAAGPRTSETGLRFWSFKKTLKNRIFFKSKNVVADVHWVMKIQSTHCCDDRFTEN